MPDLGSAAVADWIAAAGSSDLALLSQKQKADPPGIAAAAVALGDALEAVTQPYAEALDTALETTDLAGDLSEVMARFGPARRLRMLHWLTEAGCEDTHKSVSRVTDPATTSGAALQQWLAALLQRELLDQLFSKDRLETLRIACERAGQPKEEHTP